MLELTGWTSSSGVGVQRMLCARFAKRVTGGDSIMNTFGAPLPPVELAIDAERIEVATGGFDGEHEAAAAAVSVVQQLRGSAPYMDLHRDSSMVVHLCHLPCLNNPYRIIRGRR
jgi:hypothetical protein